MPTQEEQIQEAIDTFQAAQSAGIEVLASGIQANPENESSLRATFESEQRSRLDTLNSSISSIFNP